MVWIVLTAIFLALMVASLFGSKQEKQWLANHPETHPDYGVTKGTLVFCRVATGAFVLATLLLLFFSSFTTVSTKNVGIETSFGAISGELGNGAHLIAPWKKVTEMDAAVQTDSYTQEDNDCLKIRIANQQVACVDVSIRWRIRPEKAGELFRNYRTFEHVRDSLVTRDLRQAVNNQFSDYNPLNSVIGGVLPKGQIQNPSLNVISHRVTAQMKHEIGNQIEVLNTIIPITHFDTQTQSRINQLQQQIALTRIAVQSKLTAKAQAEANRALSTSVNNSPNVLVAHCIDILSAMVKNRQAVPAGFSCWPGGKLTGVIAGPTTSK